MFHEFEQTLNETFSFGWDEASIRGLQDACVVRLEIVGRDATLAPRL